VNARLPPLLLVVGAATFLPTPTSAAKDDAKPPLIPDRIVLAEKARYAVTGEEDVVSYVNGKEYHATSTFDLVLQVAAFNKDGSYDMTLQCKRVRARYTWGDVVKEVDTDAADPWKGTEAGGFGGTQSLHETKGRTATFTLSARGVVTKIMTPLRPDIQSRSATGRDLDQLAALQRYFQPLPEKPLAKGGKWTAEMPFAPDTVLDDYVSVAVVVETYQYKEPDGASAVAIAAAKEIKPTQEIAPLKGKPKKGDRPAVKEVSGEATLYVAGASFDSATGLATERRVEAEVAIHRVWSDGGRTKEPFTQKLVVRLLKLHD